MLEIILVRSNSNLAAHFRSIVLTAICLLLVAAAANGGAPANTNNQLTATDVHGVQRSCKNHHEQGMGAYRMSVDSKTGKVTTVSAVKSTG